MFRRCGLLILGLPIVTAIPVAPALAQYYSPPPGYVRSAPPPGYFDDGTPPPAFWNDDDDDDQPVRRWRRHPRMSQVPPRDEGLPPPAFVPPDGRSAPAGEADDPDVVRPPGSIGSAPAAKSGATPPPVPPAAAAALPPEDQPEQGQPKELPENLRRQMVDYQTKEAAGTLIIDTPNTYLYLVLGHGKALRYGIGVGREGFTWSGTERISNMREWPDWYPPAEMIERQPYLPRMMAGGPGNPLGARALYLGHTLYRIHGTNQPSTIGKTVSSGCIRLLNEDIEDLYSRVQVGTRVVVLPGKMPETVANSTTPGIGAPDTRPANNRTLNADAPDPVGSFNRVPHTGAVLNAPNNGNVLNVGAGNQPQQAPQQPPPPPATSGNDGTISNAPLPPLPLPSAPLPPAN